MPAGAPGSRYDVVVTASRDGRSDEARLRVTQRRGASWPVRQPPDRPRRPSKNYRIDSCLRLLDLRKTI